MKKKNYAANQKKKKTPNYQSKQDAYPIQKKKKKVRCLSTNLLDWIICRKDKQWKSNRTIGHRHILVERT